MLASVVRAWGGGCAVAAVRWYPGVGLTIGTPHLLLLLLLTLVALVLPRPLLPTMRSRE